MDFLQKARNKIFWTIDFFNSKVIKNNLDDIQAILDNYLLPQSKVRREQLLNGLLTHAATTTPYYRHLVNFNSLNDFPVVNKHIISTDYQLFKSGSYSEKETYEVYTSGSTGTPFFAYLNKAKKYRNTADTIFFAGKVNFRIGNQLIYIRKWADDLRKSSLLAMLQNVKMIDVTDLSDAYIENFIRELQKDKSEKGLLGYTSALSTICKYLDKVDSPPLNCNVTSIIANAESLSDYCKSSMEKHFGIPVVSRYSNMENGILAHQFYDKYNYFHINWASYVVEIVDEEKDEPVEHGVLGRIVITDLFNYAMPMIRYDTGDLGIMDIDETGKPVLTAIQGRKLDMIYDTEGRMVSPTIVWELEYYKNIKQFQLVQNDEKKYTIKLNVDEGVVFAESDDIVNRYKKYLGEDAVIIIEQTGEIPILASGKRKLVVNNYHAEPKIKSTS